MSGHPAQGQPHAQGNAHYDDGYGHAQQGNTDSYYQDDHGQQYYDNHDGYTDNAHGQHGGAQQQHHGGDGYYDESYVG